tara:strand:- start:5129 stop:5347 length:219 start_codon:yes stop_codon:yes gene_type:complete
MTALERNEQEREDAAEKINYYTERQAHLRYHAFQKGLEDYKLKQEFKSIDLRIMFYTNKLLDLLEQRQKLSG